MRALLVLVLCAASAAAVAQDWPDDPDLARKTSLENVSQELHGLASWYGLTFQGRRTASGERFDMNALTAAHPTLPFGTRVKVLNPANGRSIEVRINDRGPHVPGRIIDLSHAAARSLGLLGFGAGTVVLQPVQANTAP